MKFSSFEILCRVCIDGRFSGSTLARPPGKGDVIAISVDLERNEASFAFEVRPDATQRQISSQSPTDATSGRWHLNGI